MTLPLELGGIHDNDVRRALELIAQKFPIQQQDMALRAVRGIVDLNGAIIVGTGFSVVRNALGDYTVTFSPAFSARPAVVVTAGTTAGAIVIKHSGATAPTASVFRIVAFISTTGAAADTEFDFVAVGPS